MNRSLALTAVFLVAVAALFLVACVAASPGGSPAPSVFTSPVDTPLPGSAPMTLDIAFDTPPTLNQPVTATVTLQTTEERTGIVLDVTIIGPAGFARRDFGVPIAAMHASQPLRVPVAFLFPVEGEYFIVLDVASPRGGIDGRRSLRVQVTRTGSVLNPTGAPGSLGAPAEAAAGPFTPGPTLTPRPTGTLAPGATPTASAGVSGGKGSISAPAACSGSLITLGGAVQYDDRAGGGS